MTEDRIPTEQELDALLSETPQFDLEAVKHRTLSRIAPPQKARKRLPLRGLCIAAVVCACPSARWRPATQGMGAL